MLLAYVQIGRPAVEGLAVEPPVPDERRNVGLEVAGGDESVARDARGDLRHEALVDVRDRRTRRRELCGRQIGDAELDLDLVPLRVPLGGLDRSLVAVDRVDGREAELRG